MSVTPAAGDPEVTVLAKIPKLPDLETHLCLLRFPPPWNISTVELRDYVPSTDQYGLGYWVPLDSVDALSRHLAEVERLR